MVFLFTHKVCDVLAIVVCKLGDPLDQFSFSPSWQKQNSLFLRSCHRPQSSFPCVCGDCGLMTVCTDTHMTGLYLNAVLPGLPEICLVFDHPSVEVCSSWEGNDWGRQGHLPGPVPFRSCVVQKRTLFSIMDKFLSKHGKEFITFLIHLKQLLRIVLVPLCKSVFHRSSSLWEKGQRLTKKSGFINARINKCMLVSCCGLLPKLILI